MTWGIDVQSALLSRASLYRRWLFWCAPKNRSTNAVEEVAIWDGEDNANFSPEGGTRLYYGAAGIFEVQPITNQVGTVIQSQTLTLSGINGATEQLIRGFEPRFAPCELHLALFASDTGVLIGIDRLFNGYIDGAQILTAEMGGSSTATITMVSAARNGTRTPAAKKSDEQQKLRSGDRIRRYGDVSGIVGDPWGAN